MNSQLLTVGGSTASPTLAGKVSRRTLRERAVELAVLDGRAPQDAGKAEWEQAKHELTGDCVWQLDAKGPRDEDLMIESTSQAGSNTPTPGWLS